MIPKLNNVCQPDIQKRHSLKILNEILAFRFLFRRIEEGKPRAKDPINGRIITWCKALHWGKLEVWPRNPGLGLGTQLRG